jgi:hypothetical protein
LFIFTNTNFKFSFPNIGCSSSHLGLHVLHCILCGRRLLECMTQRAFV